MREDLADVGRRQQRHGRSLGRVFAFGITIGLGRGAGFGRRLVSTLAAFAATAATAAVAAAARAVGGIGRLGRRFATGFGRHGFDGGGCNRVGHGRLDGRRGRCR
ncbi:hypothetical protein, partial [Rubrivivax gelatinosus]|uniref:hypothetical protein n=1 Tax=Rubrivivax gelatinosus TaxID=28068 RepID=UPI0031F9E245